jgi:CHAD domain-containing protein
MTYRYERDFSTVQDGIREIAAELIEDAAACIDAKGGDIHQKVHGARKACKKLRGLIRIVRPILPGYASENAAFREAGRKLSFLRDGGVLIETYDGLLESYADQIDRSKFAPIRRRLTLLHKALTESDDVGHALEQFRQVIAAAGKRVHRWQISADGFDALEPGIGKSYKSARRAMAKASEKPTAEAIHEWRKRVKDHWYHARLLYPIWPKPMKAHSEVADRLGDALGKHHDLEVFRERLISDDLGHAPDLDVLAALVRRRQKVLESEAFSIGARLLAEPVDGLTYRWRRYWDAWRADEPREVALAA